MSGVLFKNFTLLCNYGASLGASVCKCSISMFKSLFYRGTESNKVVYMLDEERECARAIRTFVSI